MKIPERMSESSENSELTWRFAAPSSAVTAASSGFQGVEGVLRRNRSSVAGFGSSETTPHGAEFL
jgi:hypothetical protein